MCLLPVGPDKLEESLEGCVALRGVRGVLEAGPGEDGEGGSGGARPQVDHSGRSQARLGKQPRHRAQLYNALHLTSARINNCQMFNDTRRSEDCIVPIQSVYANG